MNSRRFSGLAARISLAFGLLAVATVKASSGAGELPVPAVTIRPGDMISADSLMLRPFPDKFAERFAVVADARDLVGKEARRTLMPGRPIPINAVAVPQLIKRGGAARLVYRDAGLEILVQVEPLQSGGAGDTIRVRNLDSGVVITAEVGADGTLSVAGR